MKKLVTVLLILALLLPAAALADEIVNSWYIVYSKEAVPEMASAFQDYDLIVAVYSFMPDGSVMQSENDIKGGTANPHCGPVGKWEANGSEYTYSILGLGSGRAFIKDGLLHLELQGGIKMVFRKMELFNPYTDYVY